MKDEMGRLKDEKRLMSWCMSTHGAAGFHISSFPHGGMAERFNAAVLKTAEAQVSGGSNPSPSFDAKANQRKAKFLFTNFAAAKIRFS